MDASLSCLKEQTQWVAKKLEPTCQGEITKITTYRRPEEKRQTANHTKNTAGRIPTVLQRPKVVKGFVNLDLPVRTRKCQTEVRRLECANVTLPLLKTAPHRQVVSAVSTSSTMWSRALSRRAQILRQGTNFDPGSYFWDSTSAIHEATPGVCEITSGRHDASPKSSASSRAI